MTTEILPAADLWLEKTEPANDAARSHVDAGSILMETSCHETGWHSRQEETSLIYIVYFIKQNSSICATKNKRTEPQGI